MGQNYENIKLIYNLVIQLLLEFFLNFLSFCLRNKEGLERIQRQVKLTGIESDVSEMPKSLGLLSLEKRYD